MAIPALLAIALTLGGATQDMPKPPPQATEPSDDIIVSGLRDLDEPGSAVTEGTLGSGRTGVGAARSRSVLELASRFAKCAVTDDEATLRLLRATIDGNINSARQRFSQTRLVQLKTTCAQDTQIATLYGQATVFNFYDGGYYDRGALYLEALRRFAPDLKLTEKMTNDPSVQARFDAREVPRARFRLPVDRQYFEIAVCLVRMQPELAARLVGPGLSTDTINRIEAAIVNRSRVCVGNAKQVYFDASQFRMYIADAVYRWAVAARGVDSLIPSS